ncbi:MAG: hypothetical protein IKZ14_07745 [Muribaculaceae bacterium]|nr:hypothetical protein [Muribaculaceae bacterium]
MVIFDYINASIFEWRKRRAIAKAKHNALTHRKKFLVLVWKKRPVVVSMQGLKRMIAMQRFSRDFTAAKAENMAIFVAFPPKK